MLKKKRKRFQTRQSKKNSEIRLKSENVHRWPSNPTTDLVNKVAELEVLCDDVEHADHLREDEHAVTRLFESHQQLVQQDQLPTALHQALWDKDQTCLLNILSDTWD